LFTRQGEINMKIIFMIFIYPILTIFMICLVMIGCASSKETLKDNSSKNLPLADSSANPTYSNPAVAKSSDTSQIDLHQSDTTSQDPNAASTNKSEYEPGVKLIVFYFHPHARCTTCLQIEANTIESVQSGFKDELLDGIIQLQIIDIQEPGNEHYSTDFNLIEQTLVIAQYKDDKQVGWKKLEKVWDYVWDEERFASYVQDEIKAMLKAS